jgi:hypothetical protein
MDGKIKITLTAFEDASSAIIVILLKKFLESLSVKIGAECLYCAYVVDDCFDTVAKAVVPNASREIFKKTIALADEAAGRLLDAEVKNIQGFDFGRCSFSFSSLLRGIENHERIFGLGFCTASAGGQKALDIFESLIAEAKKLPP